MERRLNEVHDELSSLRTWVDMVGHTQRYTIAEARRADEESTSKIYEINGPPTTESHLQQWSFVTWCFHKDRANIPPSAVHSHT
eukprot:2378653-Heterocapsa_arctica.AAC.1